MKRKVEITAPAEAEIEKLYLWIREDAPGRAAQWRQGLYQAAERLSTFHERFGVAPESKLVPQEIRQFFYRPCRILYTVTEDAVYILHVRHAARRFMKREELTEPSETRQRQTPSPTTRPKKRRGSK